MTTEAKVTWVEDRRFVGRATSGHAVVVDASAEKEGPSPMEMVLIGTVGCTAYDVLEVLHKKRQQVSGLEVSARAERAETPPQAVSRKAVEDAIRLSKERYCSASTMLAETAKITTSFRIAESNGV